MIPGRITPTQVFPSGRTLLYDGRPRGVEAPIAEGENRRWISSSAALFTVGLACVVGAIVGGGLKAFGIELPLLASKTRQALLGVVGLGMVGLAVILGLPAPQPTPAPAPGRPAEAGPTTSTAPSPAPAVAVAPPASPAPAPAASPAPHGPSAPIAGCADPDQALNCLPPSSRPVAFADPRAANAVAWTNVRNGLSTSQAEAESIRRGASGRAARLCGIMQSNDSSPLGLHMAAVRLSASAGSLGDVDSTCAAIISKLL